MEPTVPAVIKFILTNGAKAAMERYGQRRAEMARDVILKELAKGKHWAITDDKAAAAMWAYQRAAREGAARLNLELMAEALVTGAAERSFVPNTFRHHAEALASLSREEAVLLACMMRIQQMGGEGPQYWRAVTDMASGLGIFGDHTEIDGCAGALTRTGWVLPVSAFDGMIFRLTRQAQQVSNLIDWADVISRKGAAKGDDPDVAS
jgi:predicted TPR repeat methyltransferase